MLLLPCKIRAIASIVLDIWYLWNSTVAQMRAWVPSFNLQHESSLYIVWLGHNLQKSLADFREITPKIATACVNCSTKLFSWQHFWCLYCVEKKRKSSFYCSHSSFKPHGGRMESKMKKRGMEDLMGKLHRPLLHLPFVICRPISAVYTFAVYTFAIDHICSLNICHSHICYSMSQLDM